MRKVILLLAFLLAVFVLNGQPLTGTKSIPGDYASIETAIAALNTNGVGAGGVTFNVAAGHTETLSSLTAGYITTVTSSAANPITFQKSGTGANPVITAAIISTATYSDGIIKLGGADYVTFDGIDLEENPANTTNMTDWGYAVLMASATDASQHVVIKNCSITLNKENKSSYGIYSNLHKVSDVNALTPTSAAGVVSNCDVDGCTISNVNNGILWVGYNAPSPYTLYGQNNRFGYTTGNSITNFGGPNGFESCSGISIFFQNNIHVANNTINGGTGQKASIYGIYTYGAYNSNVDIYNNTVTITPGAPLGSLSECYAIYNNMGTNGTDNTVNIHHNVVENCNGFTGLPFSGIHQDADAKNVNIYYNIIRNNSSAAESYLCYNGSLAENGTENIYNNQVYGNTNNDDYSATLCIASGHFSSNTVRNIYGNQIYNNGGSQQAIYGIASLGSVSNYIYNNTVYNLYSTNNGLNTQLIGLWISNGNTYQIYNNYISDLKAPSSGNPLSVLGIFIENAFSYANLYYNTIYLDATSNGANFGTAGVYTNTSPNSEMKNNIIVNKSTANGTGYTVAYHRSNTTLTTYSAGSDYNDFYAGTPGPKNLIFYDGTNMISDFTAYQAHVGPTRDAASFTEMPPFVNSTTPPYDLHLQTTVPTRCESGGSRITTPAITTDYDGNIRQGETGYTGTGTAPDVGADEFGGIPFSNFSALASVTAHVSCHGNSNGAVTVTVTGGTSPYTYAWSTGSTNMSVSSLPAGTYWVTVTDGGSATATSSATVTQPALLTASASVVSHVSIYQGSDGSATVAPGGGTSPFTYNWSNSTTTQANSNLTAGTYWVTVTDGNSCTATSSATVTQPTPPVTQAASIDFSVVGSTQMTLNWTRGNGDGCTVFMTEGSSGVAPPVNNVSYPANTVFGTPASQVGSTGWYCVYDGTGTTVTVTGLTAGTTYRVHVCEYNLGSKTYNTSTNTNNPANYTTNGALAATASVTSHVTCNGLSNGAVTVSVTGGAASYTYNWSNGNTNASVSNLPAGTYWVTVTDATTATAASSATITQPASLSAMASVTNHVGCFGSSNGAVTVSATGGTASYTYNWSNGSSSQSPGNLPAGTYWVTVTDGNSCTASSSATVTQPLAVTANASVVNHVACHGGSSGAVTVSASGGFTPYTFAWSNGATTATVNNLPAGTFTVTVTDANTCTTTAMTTLTQPAPVPTTVSGTSPICQNTAGLYTTTSGMSNYLWSVSAGGAITSGGTTNDPSAEVLWNNHGAQSVSVTFTDPGDGCTYTGTKNVTVNPAPTPVISGASVVTVGQTVTYSTPLVAGHTYSWSASHGNAYPCMPDMNCLTLTWDFPCGIVNPGWVKLTETDTATGCSTTTTLWITVNP